MGAFMHFCPPADARGHRFSHALHSPLWKQCARLGSSLSSPIAQSAGLSGAFCRIEGCSLGSGIKSDIDTRCPGGPEATVLSPTRRPERHSRPLPEWSRVRRVAIDHMIIIRQLDNGLEEGEMP